MRLSVCAHPPPTEIWSTRTISLSQFEASFLALYYRPQKVFSRYRPVNLLQLFKVVGKCTNWQQWWWWLTSDFTGWEEKSARLECAGQWAQLTCTKWLTTTLTTQQTTALSLSPTLNAVWHMSLLHGGLNGCKFVWTSSHGSTRRGTLRTEREKGGRKIITEDNKGVPYVILLLLFLSVSLSNLEILRFLFLICKVVCERLSKSIICCCGCCSWSIASWSSWNFSPFFSAKN